MTTPEEDFDSYASHGEDFNAEDQVATLLTENQNMPELTARVAECKATYLSELQVLLMGYHADFLQIGKEMKEVCDVVEELKYSTRRGRTAIGDVSAWSLPYNNNNSSGNDNNNHSSENDNNASSSTAGFALGDPWAEEEDAAEQFNHHHLSASSSSSSQQHQQDQFSLLSNNNKINQVILPVSYLATLAKSNSIRPATLDQAGQAQLLISTAQKTERLLHCALERVQRRIISNREIFGLKEIDELAAGAAEEVSSSDVRPASSSLCMLRSSVLDSFENESWNRHPLGIGDLEPRWKMLAAVGRTAAASSLLLRTHSALINDFSTSLVQSSIDIRMSILRFSTVLSAIIEHAAIQRQESVVDSNTNNNNTSSFSDFNDLSADEREDDDPASLSIWSMIEITRAATDVFAPFIERRKHIAPNAEAAASSRSFQSATIVVAADSIAMDIALANNLSRISSSCPDLLVGPLSFSLLRTMQPNQLSFFWDQVKTAIATDFNFSLQETSLFLGGNSSSSTSSTMMMMTEEQQALREICGVEKLHRQSCVRCISPFLPGVTQHKGVQAMFDTDEWLELCGRSGISTAELKRDSDEVAVIISTKLSKTTFFAVSRAGDKMYKTLATSFITIDNP